MKAHHPDPRMSFGFRIRKIIGLTRTRSLALGAGVVFASIAMAQEGPPKPGAATTTATPAATGTAPAGAAPSAGRKLVFTGAPLRDVLDAMAKDAKMSIIIPPDITGTVTARMENIPTEKAMRTILESQGYSLVETDGIYQVKSGASVATEPTKIEVYQFANAPAKDAMATVSKLLTKSGNVQLDDRSNTLIITDVGSNLPKVLAIVKTLDSETPQVMIETKLLETTRNPVERYGIDWSSLSGYTVSLAQPGSADGTPRTGTSANIFGITRSGDPGAIGAVNAGRRGGVFTPATAAGVPYAAVLSGPAFNWTLSFLLNDADSELLGSPKVITTDNKEATITIATQEPIPNFQFNASTASFVISGFEYRNVGNTLKVTPHVNRENFVTLDVEPQVSTAATAGRTFSLPGGSVTVPLISIRNLNSRVKVKSGSTLALGGLLEQNESRTYSKVPFLGDIPGLGELFRSHNYTKAKRNLLIFITPTIISADGGSGLEDQYNQLKEGENDRFAYKKSFIGNAKPMDQFRTLSTEVENVPVRTGSGAVKPGGAGTVANTAAVGETMDDTAQENLIDAQLMIKQAEALFQGNNYGAALAVCQDAEKKLAKIPEATVELDRVRQYQSLCLSQMAKIAYDQKEYNQAATLARRAYQLDAKNRDAYQILQDSTQAGGQPADAAPVDDSSSSKEDALEKAATEKEAAADVDTKALTPRVEPGLRE